MSYIESQFEIARPQSAIVAYEIYNKVYLQSHQIVKDYSTGQYSLGAGVPLTQDVAIHLMSAFLDSFRDNHCNLSYLEEAILAYNPTANVMVWYRKSVKRAFFTKLDNGEKAQGVVTWPALVFRADDKGLRVFALPNNKRPEPNTELYTAPLWNIDNQGRLCFGTASQPDKIAPEYAKTWEDAVYNTRFTHANGSKPRLKGDFNKVWMSLMKSGKKFPVSKMCKEERLTLTHLLEV